MKYIVVVPQDYHSAGVFGSFNSRKEGEDYIKNVIEDEDERQRAYVTELTK